MDRVAIKTGRKRGSNWTGRLGLLLLITTIISYWWIIRPLEQHTHFLREQAMTEPTAPNVEKAKMAYLARDELNKFYRDFPVSERWSPQIAVLFRAAAQEGLALETGNYRANTERRDRLTRLEIDLPLKGTYVQIRRFITRALSTIPTATLQRFKVKRSVVSGNLVEAQVNLVVYLSRNEDE